MKYYLNGWKNIFNYQGRSTRKDFWMFFAIDLAISASLFFSSVIAFYVIGAEQLAGFLSLLYLAYILVGIAPQLALWIRRFHDRDKSGWFYLMILIPIFGQAYLIYNALMEGSLGENRYGPDPKDINANVATQSAAYASTDLEAK